MSSPRYTSPRHLPALCFLCVLIFSLFLAACGTSSTGSTTTATPVSTVAPPTGLRQSGQLLVGSDTTYTPMEYVDTATNQYAGFDIDLITAIANHMGLHEKTQQTSFDTIFNDLSNKRFDLVISSVTVTADREKVFNFVQYFKAGESLLVPKGNPKHLKQVSDLCGLSVGVQTATTEQADLQTQQNACTRAGKGAIKLTILDSQTDVIQLLATGRVDATYQDSPVTDYYNKINPGHFEVGGSVVNTAPYGIAIRKSDTSMYNAVKAAFQAVQADGTYNNLFTKWSFSPAQKI